LIKRGYGGYGALWWIFFKKNFRTRIRGSFEENAQ
jgi:hypothetical protein